MSKLYAKEIVDYETSCSPVMVKLTEPSCLKKGDHIHWRHIGSWHDGIIDFVSIPDDGPPKVTLVRYAHLFGSGMVIQEETWQINFARDVVYRYDYEQHCHPPHTVVARARACVSQRGYNALRNSNDDFCRWSKTGKHTYLCINETLLGEGIVKDNDEVDTYTTCVSNFDDVNQGDHVLWSSVQGHPEGDEAGWRHGIIVDIDQKRAEVIGFCDKSHSIATIYFCSKDLVSYKFRRIVYEKCNMPDEVVDRAKYHLSIDAVSFPEDSRPFAKWCKTGIPADSDTKEVIVKAPDNDKTDGNANEQKGDDGDVKEQIAKGAVRSATTTFARSVESGVASTVARQVPRVLVRGAAEGAAAVAAVGVEAIVLGVDIGLTYKSFSKREISKDEMQRRHIQNTFRSGGAAAASVGGGAAGAAIGTLVFPGVGTLVGGIIGGIIGGISGQVGGHFAGKGIAYAARRPYENLFVEDGVELA